MNKEYWFFRLKDDFFFKDKNIRKMKRMPNSVGCEYIVILLELYCLSLENGGVYEADHNVYGEVDFTAIAADIQHQDISLVRMAVEHLIAVGLIEVTDEEDFVSFKFPQVVNSFAKSSEAADKKRLAYNEKHKLSEPKTKAETPQGRGREKNVTISEQEYREFCRAYEDAEKIIDIYSLRKLPESVNDFDELCKMAEIIGKPRQSAEATKQILAQVKKAKSKIYKGVFSNVALTQSEWDRLQRMYADPKGLVDVVSQRLYAKPEQDSGRHYAFCLKVGKEDAWMTLGEKMKEKKQEDQAKEEAHTKEAQKIYNRYRSEADAGFEPPKEIKEILGEEAYEKLREIAQAAWERERESEGKRDR